MQKFIALALIGAIIGASAPAFAVDTKISELCGPDGPESYKRPGGYCEQIGENKSQAAGDDQSLPWWWDLPT